MKFNQYFLLREARASEANKIHFGEPEFDYLNKFISEDDADELKVKFLSKAIQILYGPDVLQKPEPKIRKIEIETRHDGKRIKRTFENVNTHSDEIIEKLEAKGYDPMKVDIVRFAGDRAAKEYLSYKEGTREKPPSLSPTTAVKGKEAKIDMLGRNLDHIETAQTREKIYLTPEDQEFLNFFDKNNLGHKKVEAFRKRYSGELINNNQATRKDSMGNIGKFFNVDFGGTKYAVPVNATKLKERIEELKEKGIDFIRSPLSRATAERWIERGWINPGHKARVLNLGTGFDKVEEIEKKQDEFLKDPENKENMNISDDETVHFNDKVSWNDILMNDAKIAAKRAIMKTQAFTSSLTKVNEEDLANDLFSFLKSNEMVQEEEYRSQRFRINKARGKGQTLLGRMITDTKRSKEVGGIDFGITKNDKSTTPEQELEKRDQAAADVDHDEDVEFPSVQSAISYSIPVPDAMTKIISQMIVKQGGDKDFHYNANTMKQASIALFKILQLFQKENGEAPQPRHLHTMVQMIIDHFKNMSNTPSEEEKAPTPAPAAPAIPPRAADAFANANQKVN